MLTGYDHLLFLFGVMFFLARFGDIVKFITSFTLGHCLTLIFATLFHVKANYYLIDAVIALTVCYKAFDNLDGFKRTIGIQSPNLLAVVFIRFDSWFWAFYPASTVASGAGRFGSADSVLQSRCGVGANPGIVGHVDSLNRLAQDRVVHEIQQSGERRTHGCRTTIDAQATPWLRAHAIH